MEMCGALAAWAAGPVVKAVWRRKRSRGTGFALSDLRPENLTDPKPPADSDPTRLRALLPRAGDAESAVLLVRNPSPNRQHQGQWQSPLKNRSGHWAQGLLRS